MKLYTLANKAPTKYPNNKISIRPITVVPDILGAMDIFVISIPCITYDIRVKAWLGINKNRATQAMYMIPNTAAVVIPILLVSKLLTNFSPIYIIGTNI